jgi:hypothetical protein
VCALQQQRQFNASNLLLTFFLSLRAERDISLIKKNHAINKEALELFGN